MAIIEQSARNALYNFILNVREASGVNRVAIFCPWPNPAEPAGVAASGSPLSCLGAIGISSSLQEHCQLSTRSGIGGWVIRHGQVLRRQDAVVNFPPAESIDVQQKFDSLSCHLAMPINDREGTIGVALLGEPLTRSSFNDTEIRTIFRLMEDLGLFIRSAWRQKSIAWENNLLNRILSFMPCGAFVVTNDLHILYANSTARNFFALEEGRHLSFDDVPANLATQIRGATEEDEPPDPFFLSLPQDPKRRVFRVTVSRLAENDPDCHRSLIVLMEDFSEVENAKQAAVDSVTARLANQLQLLSN